MPPEMFQFLLLVTIALLIVSNLLLAFVIWTRGEQRPQETVTISDALFDSTVTDGDLFITDNVPDAATDTPDQEDDLEMIYLANAVLVAAIKNIEAKYSSLLNWREFKNAYEAWYLETHGSRIELSKATAKALFKTIKTHPGLIRKATLSQSDPVMVHDGQEDDGSTHS